MKYDFDNTPQRYNTNSIKWNCVLEKFGRNDLLPLWVADMDFTIAPEIKEAIRKRNEHAIYGYTMRPKEYYEAFLQWLQKKHNWQVKKEWILDVPGVVPGLNFCVQALTKPQEQVLTFSPVYDPFYRAIELNKRKLVISNLLLKSNHYEIDFVDLEDKLKKGVKLILFCSPHNPVGRVWKSYELEKLANLALKYNVWVVSDEIHFDLVFPPHKHIPLAKIGKDIAEKTVTLTCPGKTFNIAGLGGGFAITSNKIISAYLQNILNRNGLHMGNTLTIAAFQAAYKKGERWLSELLVYLYKNYKLLKKECENIGIEVVDLEGTYLAWLNFNNYNISHKKLEQAIYDRAKLGLVSGTQYGLNGKGFMRFNFACNKKTLQEAIKRLKKILPL